MTGITSQTTDTALKTKQKSTFTVFDKSLQNDKSKTLIREYINTYAIQSDQWNKCVCITFHKFVL